MGWPEQGKGKIRRHSVTKHPFSKEFDETGDFDEFLKKHGLKIMRDKYLISDDWEEFEVDYE